MNTKSVLLALALGWACITQLFGQTADTIYQGGNIITVNDAAPFAEALAVKNGKILAVGSKADVLKAKGDATKMVDLRGMVLLPGFVDGHSHVAMVGIQAASANMLPAPDGEGNSIAALQKLLKEWSAKNPLDAHLPAMFPLAPPAI